MKHKACSIGRRWSLSLSICHKSVFTNFKWGLKNVARALQTSESFVRFREGLITSLEAVIGFPRKGVSAVPAVVPALAPLYP